MGSCPMHVFWAGAAGLFECAGVGLGVTCAVYSDMGSGLLPGCSQRPDRPTLYLLTTSRNVPERVHDDVRE